MFIYQVTLVSGKILLVEAQSEEGAELQALQEEAAHNPGEMVIDVIQLESDPLKRPVAPLRA